MICHNSTVKIGTTSLGSTPSAAVLALAYGHIGQPMLPRLRLPGVLSRVFARVFMTNQGL